MPLGVQGAENIGKPGTDRAVRQAIPVACSRHVAFQGQHRGHQLVQFKAGLQHRAVDIPGVDAQVAPLAAKYIVQHPAGQGRVSVHYRGEAPQQAVPVPVSRAHVVTRAAAGNQDQLLGVQGKARGVEQAEEQIGIVETLQLGVRNGPAAGLQPVHGHLQFMLPALAQHLLGAGGGRHLLKADTPVEGHSSGLAGFQRTVVGQTVGDTGIRLPEGGRAGLVHHGRKREEGKPAAHIEDQAVVPEAGVAPAHPVDLLVLVDTVPCRGPAPLQSEGTGQRPIQCGAYCQLVEKATLPHRGQEHPLHLQRAGDSAECGNPVGLPCPGKGLERNLFAVKLKKRRHQGERGRTPLLNQSFIPHVQEGKGLQRPGTGLERGQGDPLVTGRQILLLHRDPSLSDLIG